MACEIQDKPVTQYMKLFSQRTSIRGIPKIENSKLSAIRWFWGFFILSAHVIMLTLVVLLITRYFRYDRTIKMGTLRVTPTDFPEVTICSKRFFGMNSGNFPDPYAVLNDYSRKLLSEITDTMNYDISRAADLIRTRYTTTYFFHANYKFIQQRTFNLSTQVDGICSISVLDGQLDNSKKKYKCKIRPILNQAYLNCLAFSISDKSGFNSSTSPQMEINLGFLNRPPTAIIDNFQMDEYISDISSDDGYQDVKVYMHKADDYPFDLNFQIPFECDNVNHYIVEKTKENQYFTGGNPATCNLGEYNKTIYGIPYKATRENLCETLVFQGQIKKQCNCFRDDLPTDDPTYPITSLCYDNSSLYTCLEAVMNGFSIDLSVICLPQCTKTDYTVLHKLKPFFSSSFSEDMDVLFDDVDNCYDDSCIGAMNCVIKKLFTNYTNVTCISSRSDRIKRASEVVTVSPQTSQMLQTINNDQGPKYKCEMIFLKIEMRKKMKVLTESLIVEVNTLFSQMGGICSFFTGLTFTLIAEILETCIFCIYDKCSAKVAPQ